jgi:hypothetical protein
MYIQAQDHLGSLNGGHLALNAGWGGPNGSGGAGGNVRIGSGSGSGTAAGGNLYLITGSGSSAGRIYLQPSGQDRFEVHSFGATIRNPAGGDTGLSFTDSTLNPTPDGSTDGILFSRDGRLEFYSNTTSQVTNLTREIISGSDVTDITGNTASASYVSVVGVVVSPPAGCKIGDIVEGDVYFGTQLAVLALGASVGITFHDGATLDVDPHYMTIGSNSYHAGIQVNYTLPFSHVVSVDDVGITLNLYFRSDGSTNLYLYPVCTSNNIWLKWRVIRPAT